MKNKFFTRADIFAILPIMVTFIFGFYFYTHFPAVIPTHWDINGHVNGYSSRGVASFLIPFIMIAMLLIFNALPFIDPHRDRYPEFRKAYYVFKNILLYFMMVLYILVGFNGIGYPMPIGIIVPILLGILFIILGNYFGKIKNNWFMGIRTPWTLSSEDIWNKTHRLGGKLFMIAGVLLILDAFVPPTLQIIIFIIALGLAIVIPIIYSFYLFQKEKRH